MQEKPPVALYSSLIEVNLWDIPEYIISKYKSKPHIICQNNSSVAAVFIVQSMYKKLCFHALSVRIVHIILLKTRVKFHFSLFHSNSD